MALVKQFRFSHHMQQSTTCLHFCAIQRRCIWAGGQLGVAACLARIVAADAAVFSCLVWQCELTTGQY